MKKILTVLFAMLLGVGLLVGCTQGEKDITVVSREAGSGTRSAFEEILGLKADEVQPSIVLDKTNNVLTEVSGNKNAIGYISLGSLNDTVKALNIGGVECSSANVINETYAMARPFELVYKKGDEQSDLAKDFAKFVLSSNAQSIISSKGYVSIRSGEEYKAQAGISGTLKVSGSTSVEPLFEALFAEYHKLNPSVELEMSATGSGSGISDAIKGTVTFGMSSRAIKDSEKESLEIINLCKDGIAVIVNKENTISNITLENLAKIYKAEIKKFSELN